MTKKTKRVSASLGVVAVIAALALPKLWPAGNDAPAATRPAGDQRLPVNVYVVAPRTLEDKILTTGSVRANEEVEIRSEISGKITQILFREGRAVQRGALLVKINDRELQAQLKKATSRLTLAEDLEERQRQLLDKGGISQQEYEATRNEVSVLRADVELIQAQLEKTEIRAPFDGTIGLRYVSEGSYVTPNTPIAVLQDVDPVKVDFSVPERYAQRARPGDAIVFNVEGVEGPFRAEIYAFEPRIEADTRTLQLRARSANPDGRLLPGAFANIELIFDEIPDAVTVPAMAVIPELNGKKVYVLAEGKAMPRPVETGIRTEDRVQIVDGLAPGDSVVTSGIQQLRPGLPVVPSE